MKTMFLFMVLFAIFGLQPVETARCQSAPVLQKAHLPPAMLPDEIPPTARTITPFDRLKPGASMRQVVAACGLPDKDIGSGVHIYVYELSDRSVVRVGTPDGKKVLYMVQVMGDGTQRDLYRNSRGKKSAAARGRPTSG